MKTCYFVFFAILIHVSMFARAEPAPLNASGPEVIKCGVLPTALYDFDNVNNEFSSSFYLWCNSKNPDFKINKTLEITNALKFKAKFADLSKRGETYLTTMRFFAKVYHEWDMTNFPFDRQTLKIHLEDGLHDTDSLSFVADPSSHVSRDVILDDWELENFKLTSEPHVYHTSFGLQKEQSAFSRMTLTFEIKRKGWRNFVNYFLGFFVAILLSLLACFVKSERFSIILGAVFSLIGTKFVLDQTLPAAGGLALSDHLELASFTFVLATALLVAIESRQEDNAGKRLSAVNLGLVAALFCAYLAYVGVHVFVAYNS